MAIAKTLTKTGGPALAGTKLVGSIWFTVHAFLLLLQCGVHALQGQVNMRFESLVSLAWSSKTFFLSSCRVLWRTFYNAALPVRSIAGVVMHVGRRILVVSIDKEAEAMLVQKCTCSELNLELCLARASKDERVTHSPEVGHAETTLPAVPEGSLQGFC